MRRERAADVLLVASLFSCAASVPVSETFWGGLFFHTTLAAAVGGVADWFAVHSLFRRPLGIPFGTAVIPKSREKIIRMARELLTQELLSVPRLYRLLKEHSLSEGAAVWVSENEETLRAVLSDAAGACLSASDGRKLASMTSEEVETFIAREDWARLLADVSARLLPTLGARPFLAAVSSAARRFLADTLSEERLQDLYRAAWAAYEEKGPMRGMLRGLLGSQLGLTDEKAVALIRQKAIDIAEDLERPESDAAQKLQSFFRAWSERLETDAALRENVNAAVSSFLLSLWRERGADMSAEMFRCKRDEINRMIVDAVYARIGGFLFDPLKRKALDRWLLWRLVPYLPRIRDALGQAAEAALAGYSGEDMARMAENGVWHDLQMIRINGTLIGAILGALSFGLFYFVSGGVVL